MDNILQTLKTCDTGRYKPIPFWSVNSRLDKKEIIRQINEMNSYGLGGFVFHARTGLITEYLSNEWFDCVKTALDEAKRLKMSVWIYDENGWPSGFVGGKLLAKEENRAAYLTYKVSDDYDESAYAVYEYTQENGARLLKKKEVIKGKYHTVYKEYSDAYTDILNPDVTERFIKETHEKYYERFSDRFGKELVGFFTDEPQYYRYATPISSVTEREYFNRFHTDVKEGLLYLFIQDEKGYPFRVKYYNLMNELYCENFYKKLICWCESKGCLLTGHTVGETYLSTQMWGSADAATSYLCEHIPAIDNLEKSLTAEISAKLVGSVAAQGGKKAVFTETFGVSGYSTTPKQLKLIADKQYVYGVDMMIQHLYNYSLAGQGKIDCPPSFGRTMPWVSGYSEFNGYFEKSGYIIANSEENAPVAVITPTESVYLDYIRLDEAEAKKNVDDPFWDTLTELRNAGVSYHFVNEKVLEKLGSVSGGTLKVGERVYDAVVVANCREIKSNTCSLLKNFLNGRGKLCVSGDLPKYVDGVKTATDIVGNCGVEDLPKPVSFSADKTVSYTYRTFNGFRFLFMVNENDAPVTVRTKAPFSRVDLVNGKGYAAKAEHVIPAGSSLFLEENGNYTEDFTVGKEELICVPHYLHPIITRYALEQGVNVLCEKPMAIKMEDALYNVALAQKQNLKYGVIFQCRFNDSAKLVKQTLESGKLGRIISARVVLTWCKPDEYYSLSDWKGTWDKEGGGVIIDQAIHSLDLANWFIDDEPISVQAHLANRGHKIMEVDDTGEGFIRYKNGATLSFWAMNNYGCDEPIEIRLCCEKGKVVMTYDDATITLSSGEVLTAKTTSDGIEYENGKDYWGFQHIREIADFYDAVINDREPKISGKEALKIQKIICEIYNKNT